MCWKSIGSSAEKCVNRENERKNEKRKFDKKYLKTWEKMSFEMKICSNCAWKCTGKWESLCVENTCRKYQCLCDKKKVKRGTFL
jgi:hypothetical protein